MAQVKVILTGDELKLLKSQSRAAEGQKKLEKRIESTGKASRRAGREAEKSFGQKAQQQIGRYAIGFVSLQTAAAGFRGVLQQITDEAQAAEMSFNGLVEARKRLAQIASPGGGLAQLTQRSDAGARRFGVERNVSASVLFSAVSEGFESDFERVLNAAPVVDVERAAGVAGQVPSLFGGQIGPLEAINAVLTGAGQSRLNFEQVASALPQAAAGAAMNQTSPEETIAALGVLSSLTKSGDTAATTIGTFANKAALDERTAGQGIVEAVRTIQQMSEEDRREFLGESKELNTAFIQLGSQLETIEQRMADVADSIERSGTDQSEINRRRAEVLADPTNAAKLEADRARIALEIGQEPLSAENYRRQAARDRAALDTLENPNRGVADRAIQRRVSDLVSPFLDPEQVGAVGTFFGNIPSPQLARLSGQSFGESQADLDQRFNAQFNALTGSDNPNNSVMGLLRSIRDTLVNQNGPRTTQDPGRDE